MKRRIRKIVNFFAFNLLFFALYLNFIHKDNEKIVTKVWGDGLYITNIVNGLDIRHHYKFNMVMNSLTLIQNDVRIHVENNLITYDNSELDDVVTFELI